MGTSLAGSANPYWDESAVPKDKPFSFPIQTPGRQVSGRELLERASEVLRVDVEWIASREEFKISGVYIENSGTESLVLRAPKKDPLGSYRATLFDAASSNAMAYATVGTGAEFRKLVRAMSFRFPRPQAPVELVLEVENPSTGKTELALRQWIDPAPLPYLPKTPPADFEIRELKMAVARPALAVNLYADGYTVARKVQFFKDAQRAVDMLKQNAFPLFDSMDFHAVFGASNQTLGAAQNLGLPVAERNSFLGLYFPYWNNFGRWYHVVYPTREKKFRDNLGLVPYDYPIVLLDSAEYWGVGNYNELTAIPAGQASFTYLLLHEFGHFFGLNEEYEGGGQTELQFARGIAEPWSQNITFLADTSQLKWKALATQGVSIPTSAGSWTGAGPYGAYRGGYADSEPQGTSHKPGYKCTMDSGAKFCPICVNALKAKLTADLGR